MRAAAHTAPPNLIPIFSSPVVRRDTQRPSLCYLDVTFLDGHAQQDLDVLVFQNYYTASISINMQTSPTTFVPILENKVLMPNPHCEAGGQTWVAIKATEFNDKYEKGRTLRIMLIQPATVWNTFEIRNCRALGRAARETPSLSMAALASSPPSSLAGLFRQDLSIFRGLAAQRKEAEQQSAAASSLALQQDTHKAKPRKARKHKVSGGAFQQVPSTTA